MMTRGQKSSSVTIIFCGLHVLVVFLCRDCTQSLYWRHIVFVVSLPGICFGFSANQSNQLVSYNNFLQFDRKFMMMMMSSDGFTVKLLCGIQANNSHQYLDCSLASHPCQCIPFKEQLKGRRFVCHLSVTGTISQTSAPSVERYL